ncbi:ATPase, partial [Vibrio xuii]
TSDGVVWDDGNYQFYGLSHQQLHSMNNGIVFGNDWHLSQTPSSMGTRYVMLRRTPVVNIASGEIVAHLYIGVVLNNNFSLINVLEQGSNADELFLAVGSEIIASSTKAEYARHIKWLDQSSNSINASRYMVSKTDLMITGVPTYLSIYTVQSNEHIEGFIKSHYLWMAFTGMLIAFVAVYTRLWLGKRVS